MDVQNPWSSVAELWHWVVTSSWSASPRILSTFLTLKMARKYGGLKSKRLILIFLSGIPSPKTKDQILGHGDQHNTVRCNENWTKSSLNCLGLSKDQKTSPLSTFCQLAAVWAHKSGLSNAKDRFFNQQNVDVSLCRQKDKRKRRRKCLHRPTSFFNLLDLSDFSINFLV